MTENLVQEVAIEDLGVEEVLSKDRQKIADEVIEIIAVLKHQSSMRSCDRGFTDGL